MIMKNLFSFFSYLILGLFLISFTNCSKTVLGVTAQLPALRPQSTDSSAGTWVPVLLSSAHQIPVQAPLASNNPSYLAELASIKSEQQNLSSTQLSQMAYWSAGNVLRWNEILRGLVAEHNLPPYQNADGTYPIPSSANPFNYPEYPFSNPPYAARAYAYVSAAQYDALIAAYYYKALYQRAAPYNQDANIKMYGTKTSLPSYPSEAGVLAGLNSEMMKLLFPTDYVAIFAKANEAEQAAILSGAATPSDIAAGDSLGRKIADLFIARAKTDKTNLAVGTPAIWTALQANISATGETPWISLETPARPPMLPLFGNVHSLITDSATLVSLRPGPPPSTSSAEMQKEVNDELQYSLHPTAEAIRITQFWGDGVGTYTPPGHWNYIASTDFINQNYSEVRWARNLAFLNLALFDAAIVCWNTKNYYFNPRPSQLNSKIKTLTGVPNFPSYISGHSTFSGAACGVLSYLIPSRASAYTQMATEASNSRVVSGIHYAIDCSTGLQVGTSVANLAINKLKLSGGN
jgi:hypothetical protein